MKTKLLSLSTALLLLGGVGMVSAACTPLPDVCRDVSTAPNVHDGPSGIGVSHIKAWGHICFYAGTANLSSQTQVGWSHSEYGPMQLGFTYTHVSMPQPIPRLPNGANGSAGWLGGFHVALCATTGIFTLCSLGTDFGCALYDDPPTVAGFGYATCKKTGGHSDFYMDFTNGVRQPANNSYILTPFMRSFIRQAKVKDPAGASRIITLLHDKYRLTV
jgi:hypothetical protein